MLCNKKNGVQGTMRLIEVNDEGKAVPSQFTCLPEHLLKEICLYYYIGIYSFIFSKFHIITCPIADKS